MSPFFDTLNYFLGRYFSVRYANSPPRRAVISCGQLIIIIMLCASSFFSNKFMIIELDRKRKANFKVLAIVIAKKYFFSRTLKIRTRNILLNIIKGSIGASGVGNVPTASAIRLGIMAIIIPALVPNNETVIKRVAFTIVPVTSCCFKKGAK